MTEPGGAPPNLPRLAAELEQFGFESVWVPDVQTGTGMASLEAVASIAAVAAVTERVRLGIGTFALPVRAVPWLAIQVATLQHLSGDRVLLGVGSGGFAGTPFWEALGVPAAGRGRRTDEALRVLPSLIAGDAALVDGVEVRFGPAASVPPILVGGNSDVAIRRAVEFGDGWLPSLIGPASLGSRVGVLREVSAGREVPEVSVGGHMFVGSGSEVDAERAAFVDMLVADRHLSRVEAEAAPMPGESPARIAEHFAAYAEAGAVRVVTGPQGGDETTWLRRCEVIASALG